MRLLIDVGNTRIKGAVCDGQAWQSLAPLPYGSRPLGEVLESWALPDQLADAWVASVGHQDICEQFDGWLSDRYGIRAHFPRSSAQACGVTNAYAIPTNLGVDRWLGMIAAQHDGGAAVVVSLGTAATIDVLAADGRHLGGLITPGLSTQRRAMLDHTQVRANTDGQAFQLLGDSTDSCVTFGTVHAIAGYVDRVVGRLVSDGAGWRLLLTGGDSGVLRPELAGDWEMRPDLVLEGLHLLADEEASLH